MEPEQKPNLPVCPHCGSDPVRFSQAMVKMNDAITSSVIYCANPACRKLLAMQIVGIDAPMVAPASSLAQASLASRIATGR
jgi:hypothetical protein